VTGDFAGPAPRQRILVIHNPTAGSSARTKLRRFVELLSEDGTEVAVRATAGPGDATAIAAAAGDGKWDAIVAAGGDGTVNEIVNGLGPNSPSLGILPLGTANVLALELGLPVAAPDAACLIARGGVRQLYFAAIEGRRFVMMAGVGFDARVVDAVGSSGLKRRFEKLAYVWQAVTGLSRFSHALFSVEIDGASHTVASAIVANGRYYGGRFICAPDARLDSPNLHVCLFAGNGAWDTVRYAVAMVLGRLHRTPDVRIVIGRSIRITGDAGEPVQADGDIVARLPVHITADSVRLSVICPEPVPR